MIRTKLFAVAAVSLVSLLAADKSHAQWGGYNPIVGGTDRYVTGGSWDPYTGRFVVQSNQHVVHASATDPYRDSVLPGSMRYVNYYERDFYGWLVHVTGWRWVSVNGVPHSSLSRTVRQYSGYGGGVWTSGGFGPGGFVGGPIVEHQTTTHQYKMAKKK